MDRKRKRLMTRTHPSVSSGSSISYANTQNNRGHHIQHQNAKSSLDCLSYAVSIKERKQHDQPGFDHSYFQQDSESGSDTTHQDSDDSDQHSHTNLPIMLFKSPTSPVTAAAETMMMFGHHSQII
ncbi:unnamed protein product [Absidia cylindrospora]